MKKVTLRNSTIPELLRRFRLEGFTPEICEEFAERVEHLEEERKALREALSKLED